MALQMRADLIFTDYLVGGGVGLPNHERVKRLSRCRAITCRVFLTLAGVTGEAHIRWLTTVFPTPWNQTV